MTATTRIAQTVLAVFLQALAPAAFAGLPTLTTARAAHQLPLKEAARAYPVLIRVVVTYYDPYIDKRRPALFVTDATGGVFVALAATPVIPLKAGQVIEVKGVSGSGDFAPIVDRARALVVGESPLPFAPPTTMTKMLTGADDGQWVEIEGVVRSIEKLGKNVFLHIELSDGEIIAGTVIQAGADYDSLVDAKIKVRGATAPTFNHQQQMTGAHLLFPDLGQVTVEEPAPAHPFELTAAPLSGLLRFTAGTSFRHRSHIRGAVTLLWPGSQICIQDDARGLCAQTHQTTDLKPGEWVDMIGFPTVGEFSPTFTDAKYKAALGGHPVRAARITPDEAFAGDHDAELVEMEGQLIGEDKAAKDPTIMLSSGKFIFSAVRPSQALGGALEWPAGSILRLTGICSVQADTNQASRSAGFSVPSSFRIMLRSAGDVVVVHKPSWWTASHALWVLAFALVTIVVAAVALFGQVRQGRETAAHLRLEMGERRRAEDATRYALDQMDYQAHHDPLTSLANRLMFNRSIREALTLAAGTRSLVGLLYLDLDRFKAINDSMGHAAGDILLKQAAERLTSVCPPGGILARLGGDEFAFLLPGVPDRSVAEDQAKSIIEVMAVPFLVDGVPWHCPASIGVSLFPEDGQSAAVLQRNADTALYRAKRTAPGQFVVFDRSMSEQAARSVLVEKALRRAVDGRGFSLVYQPQFAAAGGLHGFEALLRLNDEVLGPMSPAEFIPIAEEIGLISAIGEWTLREACHQRMAWECGGLSRVSIAVNVSPLQLKLGHFPALVRNVLEQTGMPADLLELELTETSIFASAHDSLLEIKALGVRISVDDFGTGFSSLSSLHGAPVDCVKIDRAFVRESDATPGTLPFIRTIVSLARGLGMYTVAEGVETASQMEAVKAAGCDVLQGYLLSYPLKAPVAGLLLRNWVAEYGNTTEPEQLVGVA
jgi:diguanylate cyclase (GGDEF)-like protein